MILLRQLVALLGVYWFSCCAAAAEQQPLSPSDFAYSLPLVLSADGAVQTVMLPVSVYRGAVDADLADLRVFNGAGQVLPHALRPLKRLQTNNTGSRELPFFPLQRFAHETGEAALSLFIERAASGQRLDIKTLAVPVAGQSKRLRHTYAYVIDTSQVDAAISALQLGFEANQQSFVLPMSVQASDDLHNWYAVGGSTSMVRLHYQGHHIERGRLVLPPTGANYLKLQWHDGPLPAAVVSVRAELAGDRAPAQQTTFRVSGQRRPDAANVYDFDLGGSVPVDRIRLLLPEDNTLVKAQLAVSAEPLGPASRVYQGMFYRVSHQGQRIDSPSVDLKRIERRHWVLTVDNHGSGLGDLGSADGAAPLVEFSFYPEQLLFVSRGDAPFRLLFGRYQTQASPFTAQELLALLPASARVTLPPQTAVPGSVHVESGAAALQQPLQPLPIRIYLLWGVLVACVVLLGVMAWRLLRDMGST